MINDKYNSRTWLNSLNSSSTGSVVAFDGMVPYKKKERRVTYLEVADCYGKITLHKKDDEEIELFIQKLKLLKNEIEIFITHLES